jgi:hypothetical protein
MLKFSQINENKTFIPDPSVIKKYASYIIPLYLQGDLKCEGRMIDEWLEINKAKDREKNKNVICDLEILAIKNIFANPMSSLGYAQLKLDVEKKCPKLEAFLKNQLKSTKFF